MIQLLDEELITSKLKEGDVSSFDYIFKKYNKKVYYFAISYLKSKEDSEDVVQEVFMNLWRFRNQIDKQYVFSKYLFKITYNATCKKIRKSSSDKKQMEEVLKNIILEDNSTDQDIEYNNLVETTNLLIKKLPTRQKEIFLLNLNEQLTSEQIAQKLDISKKTVENYLTMTKISIRKSIFNGHIMPIIFFWFLIN